MRKIVIEVSGGNIQGVYSTEKENDAIAIYAIDWDNIEAGEVNNITEFTLQYLPKEDIDLLIDHANYEIKQNREKYD